ncbi:ABC transporter permease [Aerococcaceae bacterium WGS1372]
MHDFKAQWSRRYSSYLKEVGKYGRLIMNDHFSILLMIILAFAGLYYRELLIQLESMDLAALRWGIIIGAVIYLSVVYMWGRPMWLTKDPDKSYLFARGEEWHQFWLKSALVSSILPIIILTLATIVILPFLEVINVWSLSESWLLIFYLVAFKLISFVLLYLDIFNLGLGQIFNRPLTRGHHAIVVSVVLFLTFCLPSTSAKFIPLVIILALVVYIGWAMSQRQYHWVAFEHVVNEEERREVNFYRWVSVFADVPHLKASVNRRAYLDSLIQFLSRIRLNRYTYLFIRSLLRNNAYSGIWLRVMVFVAVLISLVSNYWVVLAMGLMSHILTLVQLVPLMIAYRNQPFQKLYPNRDDSILKSFQWTSLAIIFIQVVVYTLITLLSQVYSTQLWIVVIAWVVVGVGLIYTYVPWWYRKHQATQ